MCWPTFAGPDLLVEIEGARLFVEGGGRRRPGRRSAAHPLTFGAPAAGGTCSGTWRDNGTVAVSRTGPPGCAAPAALSMFRTKKTRPALAVHRT